MRGVNMLGLVSISFRGSTPAEIINAVKKAGLDAIEWGGDIHVPHGDTKKAAEVCKMCKDFGISIPEYGSYYIIGQSEHDLYKKVIESCHALETNCVRVWPLQGNAAIRSTALCMKNA
jgi:3-dehydroshikimate dehydratase